ncbi:DUF362 domain-containing protein [Thermoproteus tenax]|uniref:DUF362 domain-containing protein n=1 Tax=Thermoproteus tenax (strain ATCC 35583 / DSM 2078 / JCM 9277 / NBRC 100435 / Kra 1) TaxID=768679 RepID=G4RL06_THETK|nr:DUF362 domain-containing protein [Thermoproteus tenax]CCC82251.1 conserved hypothetical protein [Thermoproteus tenax Kra 1]
MLQVLGPDQLPDIPNKDALLLLAVHSYIPVPSNPRPEIIEAVLERLQGRDITITFSMSKSYFEKAVKILGLEKLAAKYRAKILQVQGNARERLELQSPTGKKVVVKALQQAFDDSLMKIALAMPVSHSQTILYLSMPTASLNVIDPKDLQNLYEGFRHLYKYISDIYKQEKNIVCLIDGKFVVEGDGPVKGFQRYWGLTIYGDNCGEVDYATAWGLGVQPLDIGYIYFYFDGREPAIEMPKTLAENRTKIKLSSNVGIQLSWKRQR